MSFLTETSTYFSRSARLPALASDYYTHTIATTVTMRDARRRAARFDSTDARRRRGPGNRAPNKAVLARHGGTRFGLGTTEHTQGHDNPGSVRKLNSSLSSNTKPVPSTHSAQPTSLVARYDATDSPNNTPPAPHRPLPCPSPRSCPSPPSPHLAALRRSHARTACLPPLPFTTTTCSTPAPSEGRSMVYLLLCKILGLFECGGASHKWLIQKPSRLRN